MSESDFTSDTRDTDFDALCELQFTSRNLEAGQMIIWEAALKSLAEAVEHLSFRAKYYDEYPSGDKFLDAMNDLAARINQIRRTSQGEA